MRHVITLLAFVVFAMGASLVQPAEAKNFTIGDPPVAVVALPDKWKPRAYDDGVEANAPDGGVYVAVEAVKIKDVETATRDGIKYFQKNGVTLDQSTMKKKEMKLGSFDAVDVTWSGKDKDGPTNVSLTFVIMSETQSVLLYLWGTDDDMKEAGTELNEIANSLKKVGG